MRPVVLVGTALLAVLVASGTSTALIGETTLILSEFAQGSAEVALEWGTEELLPKVQQDAAQAQDVATAVAGHAQQTAFAAHGVADSVAREFVWLPHSIGDRDGDGLPEVAAGAGFDSGCLCDCPVPGAILMADVAGQRTGGFAAVAVPLVCGFVAYADLDPGAPEAAANGASLRPFVAPWWYGPRLPPDGPSEDPIGSAFGLAATIIQA